MSRRFAVVHEAEADFQIATELADRVFVEAMDWLEGDQLRHYRTWIDFNPSNQRLSWKSIATMARNKGIRPRGHFNGEPGQPDAAAARRAILYLKAIYSDLDAILLIRDQDDQPERRNGLEQARREHAQPPVIVIGLAIVERECWVLSGFESYDDEERSILEAEAQYLGFNPCERSQELTACKQDQAKRSPKRVVNQLTRCSSIREQRCWKETRLQLLRERGRDNGLVEFLEEITHHIRPLIGSHSS